MAMRGIQVVLTENAMPGKNEALKNVAPMQHRSALGDIGNTERSNLPPPGPAKQMVKAVAAAKLTRRPLKTADMNEQMKELKIESTTSFSAQLLHIEDIDRDDSDNPQLVSDLVNDIYDYLRFLENKQLIRRDYLHDKVIQPRMRVVLVDWLIQVHLRFGLLQETLYLTIAVLDRVLQDLEVQRNKLQLVGITAMFIASKYEEMCSPDIDDFAYVTANAFTKKEIRQMEIVILKCIDFALGRPLPLHFLRRNSKAGEADVILHTLSKYLMELTLPEYDMVHYAPSLIAAAAFCLARKLVNKLSWNATLTHYSKYAECDLELVMKKMCSLVLKAETSKYQTIRTKYASKTFLQISAIPELQSSVVKHLASLDRSHK